MAASCLPCLSCLVICSSVLHLLVWLCDAGASGCPRIMHKKVGDTVELSSCSSTEGITMAKWRYGGENIAVKDSNISAKQFQDRLYFNPKNFSLTLRNLTVQDSGEFIFLSWKERVQMDTVSVNLQVHEPLSEPPAINHYSTKHPVNESCTIYLECIGTADSSAMYSWTVRNQTIPGSRLNYSILADDRGTKFTCTVDNFVSVMSASSVLSCREGKDAIKFVTLLSVASASCLFIIIIVVATLWVCRCKKHLDSDTNDVTVYADISEIATQDTLSSKVPCSVYETINSGINPETPGPTTLYDKVQFSRLKNTPLAAYQEIP